jgi:hypothetical protein
MYLTLHYQLLNHPYFDYDIINVQNSSSFVLLLFHAITLQASMHDFKDVAGTLYQCTTRSMAGTTAVNRNCT